MIPLEWSEEGRTALFAAYAKAQAEMGAVSKDATNPAFKTSYATLASAISAVVPAMNAHGLAVLQSPSFDGEVLTVETIVTHAEGGWLKSILNVAPTKLDAQGLGSATTYLRRYALMALAGVAPEDDDGNASIGGERGTKFEQSTKPNGGGRAKLDGFIADMKARTTVQGVDDWAGEQANAIMEKLNRREQDEMQAAYEAYRKQLAPVPKEDAPPADAKAAAQTKSLADRAFLLESAMRACTDAVAVQKIWDINGKVVRAELDKHDPERLGELSALFEGLYATLPMPEMV